MKKTDTTMERFNKINEMFKKLGCVNEDTSRSMSQKQSLLEYYDTEGKIAYVYNIVRESDLESVGEFSYRDEFLGSNVGMVYTSGAYTNYKLYHPFNRVKGGFVEYGGGLVKYKIINGFQNFLIFSNHKMAQDFNVPPMDIQISKFNGLAEELRKRYEKTRGSVISYVRSMGLSRTASFLIKGGDIVKGLKIATEEADYTSNAAHVFCHTLLYDTSVNGAMKKTAICAKYGVRGLLFFGPHDGPVAIFHNLDDISPEAYTTETEIKNYHITDPHDIKWNKFDHVHDESQINHVEYFMNRYFPNGEYIYTKQTRTHEGELLVKSKDTGKWVFIDTMKKSPLFDDIQFAYADVFFQGKAPIKVNKDDDEIFVDKEGNMYANRNDDEPIGDIRTYLNGSNDEDDWDDWGGLDSDDWVDDSEEN